MFYVYVYILNLFIIPAHEGLHTFYYLFFGLIYTLNSTALSLLFVTPILPIRPRSILIPTLSFLVKVYTI